MTEEPTAAVELAVGVHEDCARRFDALAAAARAQIAALHAVTDVPGFGGFPSADLVRRSFELRAAEAIEQLRRYADTAASMAETFRALGAEYAGRDADVAAALGSGIAS
jgi:hypothetical protein